MNLWVRKSGLILLSALTLFSCEEELSTVGLPPENDLGIFFVDVPMADKVSQVWIDSLNTRGSGNILTGSYQDEYFGYVEAVNFSMISPVNIDTTLAEKNITLDSLVLEARIRGIYGSEVMVTPQKIEIYQMIDTLDSGKPYTAASFPGLGQKLAESEFILDPDSVGFKFEDSGRDEHMDALDSAYRDKFFDDNDVYIYKNTFRINDAFAQDFFNRIVSNDPAFKSRENFVSYMKGIAFVPVAGNSAIIRYGGADTQLVLYYTETDDDGNKSQETFTFGVVSHLSYNHIKPNSNTPWSGSDFDELSSFYEPHTTTSGMAYLQSGTNLYLKIDLSAFNTFKDTVENAVVQQAELIFENLKGVSKTTPVPANLGFYLTNRDSLEKERFAVSYLRNNNGDPAVAQYDDENNLIRNNITLALQDFLQNNIYDQIIVAPVLVSQSGTPSPDASHVQRMVVDKNDIRIRFYYTIPDKNQE